MTADLRLLAARRDRALARMSVLSEANGSRPPSPDRKGPAPPGKSGPPVGVRLERIKSQRECPDKDRSLFDFYAWQFAKATTQEEMSTLCFLAENDLDKRSRTGMSTADLHRARNRSILSSKYVDQPPEVVAAAEGCSAMHVRRHRQANGMNAVTGKHER